MPDERGSRGARRRFSAAELAVARRLRLPDLIADDLSVLFCGINPGLSSAAAGRHFASPGSRFWPALHRSGFTPQLLGPEGEDRLLGLGIGITSLVHRPTARAAELTRAELAEGGERLRQRVEARRPAWLAVLGVTGYRAAFGVRDARVGPRSGRIGSTAVWVLPSPSGLNAHFPPASLTAEFARLRAAAGLPDWTGSTDGDGRRA